MVFHLTRGKNGFTVRHVGTLVDDEDGRATVSANEGTGSH